MGSIEMRIATWLLAIAVFYPAAVHGQTRSQPWGRVSFYGTSSATSVDGGSGDRRYGDFVTSVAYQVPDQDADGFDYGVDVRHSGTSGLGRPQRASIYEAFAGARLRGGTIRVRAGHLWLTDLGALGAVAGASVEVRQRAAAGGSSSRLGRLRVGMFAGLEPQAAEAGYEDKVRKTGGYVIVDGAHARRHVAGFVNIRDGSINERSVVTTTNFLPVGRTFFLYQSAEIDVTPPAGGAHAGLAYFMANARVSPAPRVDVHATYNRGRSIDTRGLAQDILNQRSLTQSAIDGLLFESLGGRVTVEVVPRVRVYGGFTRDKTNRDDAATGRTIIGGYAANVLKTGVDVSASNAVVSGPGRDYQSRFLSAGRRFGRAVYASADYSTSLALLHFSRSDGLAIELRPQTRRVSGNATIYLTRTVSLLAMIERTHDDTSTELRIMSGVTYRFR